MNDLKWAEAEFHIVLDEKKHKFYNIRIIRERGVAMNFDKLTAYIDTLQEQGVPSGDLIVYKDHKMIYRHMSGYRDQAMSVPLTGKETYSIYSCSKVMTTCAAMQLVEQGKLQLDEEVGSYLPAFKNITVKAENGAVSPATKLTVRFLMSMQGGLDYDLNAPCILEANKAHDGKATTREIVEALAQKPLQFEPGTDFMYSLCHDVLAAVIEGVSGKRFSTYLKENIWDKIGLEHTGFEFTPYVFENQCAQWWSEGSDKPHRYLETDDLVYKLSPNYESGGAGIITTTEDYAKFADAIACDGMTINGISILRPETIKLWSTPQLCEKAKHTFDTWCRYGYSYGLGVRTRVDTSIGRKGPIGEFGWDGAAGAYTFIDPVNHLSCFFAMHVRNFGYCYEHIHPTLQTLIYEGIEQ